MAHQIAEYREAGMDGHAAKPLDVLQLVEEIERVLQAWSEPATTAVPA